MTKRKLHKYHNLPVSKPKKNRVIREASSGGYMYTASEASVPSSSPLRTASKHAGTLGAVGGGIVGALTGGVMGAVGGAIQGAEIGHDLGLLADVVMDGVSQNNMSSSTNPDHEVGGAFVSSAHVRGAKKVIQKKKNSVKVSPYLRKAVNKVINDKLIHGHYKEIVFPKGPNVLQITTNMKSWFPAGGMGTSQTSNAIDANCFPAWLFTPTYFVHAASVLFNGKSTQTAKNNSPGVNSMAWTVGNDTIDLANVPANFAVTSSSIGRLKFNIKSCHITYHYKNISANAMHLEFYVCKPKKRSSYDPLNWGYTAATTDTGAVAGSVDASQLMEPMNFMYNAATTDCANINTGIDIAGSVHAGMSATPTPGGIFLESGVLLSPMDFPTWRQGYACETIKVVLQPGQLYELTVHGPSNLEFDSAHCFSNQIWQNIQMYSRSVMVSLLSEVAWDNSFKQPVFAKTLLTNTVGALTVYATHEVKLSMPEETIGAKTGANMNDLQYRRPMLAISYNGALDDGAAASTVFTSFALGSGASRTFTA